MNELWAVTAYFNPVGYRRRRANYNLFRKHLRLPLATVELAYGGEFELGASDADILIRIRGQDVMWQKERLLNLAIEALPPSCSKVVWLDADLIFEEADWPERTARLLDRHPLVQPFSHAVLTDADWRPGDALPGDAVVLQAVAHRIELGLPVAKLSPRRRTTDNSAWHRLGGATPASAAAWYAGDLRRRHHRRRRQPARSFGSWTLRQCRIATADEPSEGEALSRLGGAVP